MVSPFADICRYPSDGGASLGQRVGHDRLVALCWHFSSRTSTVFFSRVDVVQTRVLAELHELCPSKRSRCVTLSYVFVKGRDWPTWSLQGLTGQEPCGGMGLCAPRVAHVECLFSFVVRVLEAVDVGVFFVTSFSCRCASKTQQVLLHEVTGSSRLSQARWTQSARPVEWRGPSQSAPRL